jgi:predicted NBD/HSP70 family sugar kinase
MLLGIDIGGTAIKLGALTEAGEILHRDRLAFEKTIPFEELAAAILAACRRLEVRVGRRSVAVGICMPGFVDQRNGVIIDGGSNVPALRTSSLPEHLARAMGVPVCMEDLACAQAFARVFEALSPGMAAPELPELFRRADHDPVARATIDQISGHIAHALGMLINSLNLEACLIGGGVAGAGEGLLGPIRRRLAEFAWPLLLREVKVLPATRGNDAGLLGSAWLASEARRSPAKVSSVIAAAQA